MLLEIEMSCNLIRVGMIVNNKSMLFGICVHICFTIIRLLYFFIKLIDVTDEAYHA